MAQRFEAVIFDMDGTIVDSRIDFQAIRSELGIGPGQGMLETIETMPPARRAEAHRILPCDPQAGRICCGCRTRRLELCLFSGQAGL